MKWSDVSASVRAGCRAVVAATLPAPCWRCGELVYPQDDWHVGHRRSVRDYPELMLDPGNHGPEHAACNLEAGAGPAVRAWRAAL